MVRACSLAFELAFVLANLTLDLCDAKVDRAVHVLGRFVTCDRQSVMELEADVDTVVMAFRAEHYVAGDWVRQILSNSFHSLSGVRLQGIGRFHVAERHRELHR